jgi:hypothetical protein
MEDWQGLFVRWTTLAVEASPSSMLLVEFEPTIPDFVQLKALEP